MKSRKLIAVLLSIVLVLMGAPLVFAAETAGSGTADDPFVIADAAGMDALSEDVAAGSDFAGKYFELAADIELNSGFVPIGSEETPFAGSFDGKGFTLSGKGISGDNAAVFGYVSGAVLTGVKVSGFLNQGDYNVGVLAGEAVDSDITFCEAENCKVYCIEDNAGGLVAYAENCTVENCVSDTAVRCYGNNAGGIAGVVSGTVINCENNGSVAALSSCGGIAGDGSADIVSCRNTAEVTADGSVAGGIAGVITGKIEKCLNEGDTEGEGNVGGIAGVVSGADVTLSSNLAAVVSTGAFCGGVAGIITEGTVVNCFNAGDVDCYDDIAGGIFGHSEAESVAFCYNAGAVSCDGEYYAGIGGRNYGTVKNCVTTGDAVTALSYASETDCKTVDEAALTEEETFTGFDFDAVWEINGLHSYNYPVLTDVNYHVLSVTEVVKATCTEDGYTEYFCSVCRKTYQMDTVPAAGHSFVKTAGTEATCTANGYAEYECSECGATDSEIIVAAGHVDADGNNRCDVCKAVVDGSKEPEKLNVFQKIAQFFNKIIDWFRNLFKK